jgi:putative transposase
LRLLGLYKQRSRQSPQWTSQQPRLSQQNKKLGVPRRLNNKDQDFVIEFLRQHPEAKCSEILLALKQQRGKRIGIATLQRELRLLALYKRAPPRQTGSPADPPAAPIRYRSAHRPTGSFDSYPSDLSDAQWEVVRLLLEQPGGRGRPCTQDRRRILNAIFYISRSGCQWRMLPKEYPPWQTVASCFYRWMRRGVLPKLYAQLREHYRQSLGRDAQPSIGIADSQSVKTTEKGAPRV